jgi:hypothetical protein
MNTLHWRCCASTAQRNEGVACRLCTVLIAEDMPCIEKNEYLVQICITRVTSVDQLLLYATTQRNIMQCSQLFAVMLVRHHAGPRNTPISIFRP